MSIKPIDYINTISKSQEVSRLKQMENERPNIQFHQGIVHQRKHTEAELKKVQKSNKSEYKIVDKYGDKDEDKSSKYKSRNRKKNRKKEEKRTTVIGGEIDIKIWYEVIVITILLSIIGIICIIISLIIIIKAINKEKNIYKDIVEKHEDIKYYHENIDSIISSFSDIVDMSLNKVESYNTLGIKEDNYIHASKIHKHPKKELLKDHQAKATNDKSLERVIELKRQGFSSKEIARKLNKGIREVEIIIKMLENV